MKKAAFLIVFALIILTVFWWPADDDGVEDGVGPGPPEVSRLATLLRDPADTFPRVTEPRDFSFPRDHGPHPAYRNEWWYVTGNLDAASGERVGFELTLFRFALHNGAVDSPSAWRSHQVYVGHFAITDAANDAFYVAERYSRAAVGLAGAESDPPRVWLEDWEIRFDDRWHLRAADREIEIALSMVEAKPPVANGPGGISQKSEEPGNASYYYSIPRLTAEGFVRIGERRLAVDGSAWLDREWGSSALSANQIGWDWFALQFDDGTELMFYALRRLDGTRDPMSAGTWHAADGSARYLSDADVELEVLDYWDSPAGGTYPIEWRLTAPALGLSVTVSPVMEDQELTTGVRYWEGAVDVNGTRAGAAVTGRGYVELTGYADAGFRNAGSD